MDSVCCAQLELNAKPQSSTLYPLQYISPNSHTNLHFNEVKLWTRFVQSKKQTFTEMRYCHGCILSFYGCFLMPNYTHDAFYFVLFLFLQLDT